MTEQNAADCPVGDISFQPLKKEESKNSICYYVCTQVLKIILLFRTVQLMYISQLDTQGTTLEREKKKKRECVLGRTVEVKLLCILGLRV